MVLFFLINRDFYNLLITVVDTNFIEVKYQVWYQTLYHQLVHLFLQWNQRNYVMLCDSWPETQSVVWNLYSTVSRQKLSWSSWEKEASKCVKSWLAKIITDDWQLLKQNTTPLVGLKPIIRNYGIKIDSHRQLTIVDWTAD